MPKENMQLRFSLSLEKALAEEFFKFFMQLRFSLSLEKPLAEEVVQAGLDACNGKQAG